jgi:macrolide-specific efflux system membrane fusion protein
VKWSLALSAAALAAWGGWSLLKPKREGPSFRSETVVSGPFEVTIRSTGTVQPENRLEVKPPVAGRVERMLVEEGQYVRKGQMLATLSSSERAALLDAARAKGPEEAAHWEDLYKATPLLAPMAGQVIERSVEPGQTVGAGESVVVLSDRLIVNVQVDETDIGRVKAGQAAKVALDAYPDRPLEARVKRIRYEAKTVNNVTMYEVVVATGKVPDFMRSGMSADVSFRIASRESALLVPSEALKTAEDGPYVLVPDPPNRRPKRLPVETGLTDGVRTEVLSGLSEGATVLIPAAAATGKVSGGTNPFMPSRPRGNRQGGGNRAR